MPGHCGYLTQLRFMAVQLRCSPGCRCDRYLLSHTLTYQAMVSKYLYYESILPLHFAWPHNNMDAGG